MKKHAFFICVILFAVSVLSVQAQTIQVSTSKDTYNYGDYLGIVINVSEVTGDNAELYIIDSSGKRSTAIPVVIQNLTTTITSPNAFDSVIFKEGKYQIEILYSGASSSAEFSIIDAGNTVMPLGSNVVVPEWAAGSISDYGLIKFLVDKNVLSVPEGETLDTDARIPSWYKLNASWWSEKKISDEEFVNGLAYLLSHKVIIL